MFLKKEAKDGPLGAGWGFGGGKASVGRVH